MDKKREANFYKIENKDFSKVFPKLIESIVHKGNKIMIVVKDQEHMKAIDDLLWLYSQLSFLPHATSQDELKEHSPIYITIDVLDNANQANIIAIMSEEYTDNIPIFNKYLFFYNCDNQESMKQQAEKMLLNRVSCCYISQDTQGIWSKSPVL